jgi:hypothetical protein
LGSQKISGLAAIHFFCDFMGSVLLDALTIFFIVSGAALLWLNLRAWRRRSVIVKQYGK